MNRRVRITRWRGVGRWAVQGVLGAGLLGLAGLLGCTTLQPRLQSDDEGEQRYYVDTIGDKTAVGNAVPIPVGGVGLVVGLEGTGGDSPPDAYRSILVNELHREGHHDINKILKSPNHALVLVSALIPPGASKNDRIDVEVSLPRGSKATSLRGGYLRKCKLFNYDFAERLAPSNDPAGPHGLLKGHALVEAEGTLLVGLGAHGDEVASLKFGRIWSGGRCYRPHTFSLVLKPDHQYGRVAALVAERINETFQAGYQGEPGTSVAEAKNNVQIVLRVPLQYRLNTPRFLRVVRLIPYTADPRQLDIPMGKGDDHRSYRQRLSDDVLDPARTVTSALRLEALGDASKPALKKGLKSEHPLVRFCSAEALAYLGDQACGEELAAAVARSPILRAFGLTAMASLDEAVCRLKLRDLLTMSQDDETRYGAFRALRTLDPNNDVVQGELFNESFWLHRVAPGTSPLVHISSTRRAEIVLFGEEPMLKRDFACAAGEFVVTVSKDDDQCFISRVPLHGRPSRRTCSLELSKVLHTLAEMGCQYPEVVTVLQRADEAGRLTCRLRCDALPQRVDVYELAQLGQTKAAPKDADAELVPAGQDLGATPNLFDKGSPSRSARLRDQQRLLEDGKPPHERPTADLKQQ
jgi:hypothetical protein